MAKQWKSRTSGKRKGQHFRSSGAGHSHVAPYHSGVQTVGVPKRTVRQIQASRSSRARKMDARLRAPLAKSEGEWMKQPNRRDLPDVDYPQKKPQKTKSTQEQWNDLSLEKRKKLLRKLNLNEKWAEQEWTGKSYDDLPKFVKDDLYSITSGERTRARFKKELEIEGEIMAAYSKSAEPIGWKEYRDRSPKDKPEKTAKATGIVSSYNKATGWMAIDFPSKPDADVRADVKSQGFRWRWGRKQWVAKWTPEREKFARGLGDYETVDIKPNWARKAENAANLAVKHENQSNAAYDRAHKTLDAIPFGQPILVGHHSEKHHRADLRKIDRLEKKGREESEIAQAYKRRAERYGEKASGENPVTVYNRIKRLEADERKLSHRKDEHGKQWLHHTQERLAIERAKYKASGGIPTDKLVIHSGDRVKTRWGLGTVGTVSKNTMRVKLDPNPVSGREVGIYSNSKGYSKLDKTDIIGKMEDL